jgi:hypothetical protein
MIDIIIRLIYMAVGQPQELECRTAADLRVHAKHPTNVSFGASVL